MNRALLDRVELGLKRTMGFGFFLDPYIIYIDVKKNKQTEPKSTTEFFSKKKKKSTIELGLFKPEWDDIGLVFVGPNVAESKPHDMICSEFLYRT